MRIRSTDALRFPALLALVVLGVVTTVGSGGGEPAADDGGGTSGSTVVDNAIVAHGGSLLVVDIASFQPVREIPLGTAPGSAIDLSAGGSKVFFPDSRGSGVGVFDSGNEAPRSPFPVSSPTGHGTAAAGIELLYLTQPDRGGGAVAVVDALSGANVIDLPLPGVPIAIAANHPSGQRVYVLTTSAGAAGITAIDANGNTASGQTVVESFALPGGAGGSSIAVDPANENLYVAGAAGLSVVDIKTGSPSRNTVVATLPLSAPPGDMVLSGNSRLFVLTPGSGFAVIDILPGSATRHTVVGSGPSGSNARFLATDGAGVVYLADDSNLTRLVADAQVPDRYVANASLGLPRPPSGICYHAGANGQPDRLYVSLAARGQAQLTMFDGDLATSSAMSDIGWYTSVLFDNTPTAGNVIVDLTRVQSGGNPGSFLETGHQWLGGTDGNGNPLGFEILHRRTAALYSPSQGAIDHIDWSFDDRVLQRSSGVQSAAVFPILCQGRDCFHVYKEIQSTSWTHHDYSGLKDTDFINPLAGPVHPDFSTSGGTIDFGYGTAGASTADASSTVSDIDNWSVTLVLKP